MNQQHSHPILSVFVILMAMAACVLPGQAAQPVPTTNPGAIQTAVAGTAQAAAQLTEQANPIPATVTSAPTATSTSTPKIGASGTSLIVAEDQSTLLMDYKAGIQLAIPAGWMSMRLNEDEYLSAFGSEAAQQNPGIMERLTVIRDADPDIFRLDTIDLHPGHMLNGVLTTISVVFEAGDTRSLEEWEQAERNRFSPYKGHKFLSAEYPQTSNGTRVLVIEEMYEADEEGQTVYYRGVFFVFSSGTIVLDLHTNMEIKDEILAEFEQVVNSVTPLER